MACCAMLRSTAFCFAAGSSFMRSGKRLASPENSTYSLPYSSAAIAACCLRVASLYRSSMTAAPHGCRNSCAMWPLNIFSISATQCEGHIQRSYKCAVQKEMGRSANFACLLLSLVWRTSRSMWQKSKMCSKILYVSQAMTHMRREHLMQVSLLAGATFVKKRKAGDKLQIKHCSCLRIYFVSSFDS